MLEGATHGYDMRLVLTLLRYIDYGVWQHVDALRVRGLHSMEVS